MTWLNASRFPIVIRDAYMTEPFPAGTTNYKPATAMSKDDIVSSFI